MADRESGTGAFTVTPVSADADATEGAARIARAAAEAAARATTRGSLGRAAQQWAQALADPALVDARPVAGDAPGLWIDVVYPGVDGLWAQRVRVAPGATVAHGLWASGLFAAFLNLDVGTGGVGVFGLIRGPGHLLQDGDRIEIYRALGFDPMESRRRRAEHAARRREARWLAGRAGTGESASSKG